MDRIKERGPMPFDQFMAAALYEPHHGYYAKNTTQVGKDGDFFTSVSVGPLFGQLLARRFLAQWHSIGKPTAWRIIECGAHDGKLANDILDAIRVLDQPAYDSLEYVIPEPLEELRRSQQDRLRPHADHFISTPDMSRLTQSPLPGIAFGNELLDALPCHLIEMHASNWHERYVTVSGESLDWKRLPIQDADLQAAVNTLGSAFPEGYCTEVRTNLASTLEPLTQCLIDGTMFWIDYGFAREDYYHPDRITGTLRTFYQHQADEDPLQNIGESDITAHVDFTAVKEAAESLGGNATLFRNQGAWLTDLAREWLLSMEGQPNPSLMRQFQTLTHPAQLGSSFHVLELSWGATNQERHAAL